MKPSVDLTVEVLCLARTPKAVQVLLKTGKKGWIPLSQIKAVVGELSPSQSITLTVPEWTITQITNPEATNPLLAAAIYWANKGFKVFPLRKFLKTPATPHGLKDGTTNLNKIDDWFNNPAHHYNLGLCCGSGLVVIDIDVKGEVDGRIELQRLNQQYGELPDTLTISTPSGGFHKYFFYPKELLLKSSANQLGKGVDIRAEGGYVVAAPSVLKAEADPKGKTSTGLYQRVGDSTHIADLPTAWIDAILALGTHPKPTTVIPTPKPVFVPDAEQQQLSDLQDALLCIPADDYDTWTRIGMALYSKGELGFSLWDSWSRSSAKYVEKDMAAKWRSFAHSQINVATVFHIASQHGWQNPAKGQPKPQSLPPETRKESKATPLYPVYGTSLDQVKLISADSIEPKHLTWAWEDWLPKGKLTLLVGAPKTGKTLLAIDVAATITRGGKFPDGKQALIAPVMFWTSEDDLDDTIVPRFKAAGANLNKVLFVDHVETEGRGQPFNPATDLPLLVEAISRLDKPPAVLIIDPIVSVTHDMNNALQVRMALLPLTEMAQKYGMAILGITHFRKSTGESGGLGERIIGSSAFLQVARMVWYAIKPKDAEGQRLFFRGDTNLAKDEEGYLYEVESQGAHFAERNLTIHTAGIAWGARVSDEEIQSYIEPTAEIEDSAPVLASAKEFLTRYLVQGEKLRSEIEEEAKNLGLSNRTLSRAKKDLGIKHRKRRIDAKSVWYLPNQETIVEQPVLIPINDVA